MTSKGPRSKLDHETRARRQKALETPREPPRPKTHWDHVLEEMVWLSKDFESERKWKLAQARKVALRASKGVLDQATKGERRVKEEEQRLRKVALNISKDMKKFWMKIEKLVLYKHQLELEDKKKKALDKHLEFLLGQTERYSTMLAENLVDAPISYKPVPLNSSRERVTIQCQDSDAEDAKKITELSVEPRSDPGDTDNDFGTHSEDETEDDEHTIDEDEALITEEERREELAALHNDVDLPIEELLKRYSVEEGSRESNPVKGEDAAEPTEVGEGRGNCFPALHKIVKNSSVAVTGRRCMENNGRVSDFDDILSDVEVGQDCSLSKSNEDSDKEYMQFDLIDDQEDGDFILSSGEEKEEKDDETTLLEEEKLANEEPKDSADEIAMLQKDIEIPLEELLGSYKRDCNAEENFDAESDYTSVYSDEILNSPSHFDSELNQNADCMDEDDEPRKLLPASQLTFEQEDEPASNTGEGMESEDRIADAAAAARSAQPTGNTFSTTKVRTKVPFFLKHPLREYQHIGLDWLVTMYEKRLNGILADEMGLGKTIMTIALLAHLACEKGIWGPHLIVVPTSVTLNWETEFLKWCPAFKILTYYGTAKERKLKRQGWLKPNYFHVCITTYRLVIQDSKVFKRKKWKYLILDEAHLIKNWKSQRWQTLLNFNSKRRILLTGTPLQNDLMELWSLMHFLMPHIFQSHQEFKDWFSNPISGMVDGQETVNKEVVDRLHNVLRPFILRRLKRDVEKQLPMKFEHVIFCRLSRRQRNLYEDFIASSETQATLASANFFGMISVIMQLRKVCNHPDLFEGRPIISSFDMASIDIQLSSTVCSLLSPTPFSSVDLKGLGFLFTHLDYSMASWESDVVQAIATPSSLIMHRTDGDALEGIGPAFSSHVRQKKFLDTNIFQEFQKAILEERLREAKERATSIAWWNSLRCQKKPTYSTTLRELVTVRHPVYAIHQKAVNCSSHLNCSTKLEDMVLSPVKRFWRMIDQIECFMFAIPAARAPPPRCWCSKSGPSIFLHSTYMEKCTKTLLPLLTPIRPAIVRRQVYFPDRRLIQFDCGKLQELAILLRRLKSEGHRALIFTQMTKMLDILEAFINLYGYTYMRLDGSTPPEERQTLMQRFNTNPKIFLFILSTRSGGVGINLVGADTVIFYDSDWNPAMDQQAQDRCHRIGQTREVHIYRLISDSTIEENILKKANQKRALDDLVIQSGGYNTEFFKKLDPMELFSGHSELQLKNEKEDKNRNNGTEGSVSNVDVEAALKIVEDEADYMALKKVEEEEAVENQEFMEETNGKLDDDELVNEDEIKVEEPADQGGWTAVKKDSDIMPNGISPNEEGVLVLTKKEDDIDMLADVKQMAAAAAASGQAISSFEDQLRPIDRYAIRFLELWDPIIDKVAMGTEVKSFEETEWELDRIEKLKEDMEAEIDDDEEPFVYERWDADFATEAYRQEVEALAQHQLMEEMEMEAQEEADVEAYDSMKNDMQTDYKPKSKKKPKRAKFKSLKKESLLPESRSMKEELLVETESMDDEVDFHGMVASSAMVSLSPHSAPPKKRKKGEAAVVAEGNNVTKKSKKIKKVTSEINSAMLDSSQLGNQLDQSKEFKSSESMVIGLEAKPVSRNRMGGKFSITNMPVKRVLMIKPEKVKKKGTIWSKDCFPSPDTWLPQEDAVLCAVVHEYGSNWSLVSETLYGMAAGGFYRGRYRHPVHCCERFRELIQRYVLSTADSLNNEKINNAGSGKALLKVTEDNVRMLLDVVSEQPDTELLLQKHFTALLSSVWRVTCRRQQNLSSSTVVSNSGGRLLSCNFSQSFSKSVEKLPEKMALANLGQGSKLLAAALDDINIKRQGNIVSQSDAMEEVPAIPEHMEITLEFQTEKGDCTTPLPSVSNLLVLGSDLPLPGDKPSIKDHRLKSSQIMAEIRFREASRGCVEGSGGWASSAFPLCDVKSRSASKSQFLGKHRLPMSDSQKPSKSKLKKNAVELNGRPEPHLLPMTVSVNDPNLKFELNPQFSSLISDDGFYDFSFPYDLDKELPFETGSSEVVSHQYVPGIISDIDDCSLSQEYTDFG